MKRIRRRSASLTVELGADVELPIGSTDTEVVAAIGGLAGGDYTVTVGVKASDGFEAIDQMLLTVLEQEPIPPSEGPITALKLINADTDKEVIEMRDGGAYNLEIVGTKLNVKAETSSDVAKVAFVVTGPTPKAYTDKGAPFSLHGDNGTGNFYYGNWNPPGVGEYNLKATPYNSAGVALTATEMKFTFFNRVMPDPAPEPEPEPPTGKIFGFGAGATGGAGGEEVTVTTPAAFKTAVGDNIARIVIVSGAIKIDYTKIGSNKTIKGVQGQTSKLTGTLRVEGSQNVIIQDLDLTAPIVGTSTQDCIGIYGASNTVIVDHCYFENWTDGACDIAKKSTNITLCNCHFKYTTDYDHALAVLIGSDPTDADEGFLDVTIYNCLFDDGVKDRCPFGRKGRIHIFNNVYRASAAYNKVSSYVTAAQQAQIRAENQVFIDGEDPYIKKEVGGKIHNSGDKFYPEVLKVVEWKDDVFTPPYPYTKMTAEEAEVYVLANAGRLK